MDICYLGSGLKLVLFLNILVDINIMVLLVLDLKGDCFFIYVFFYVIDVYG